MNIVGQKSATTITLLCGICLLLAGCTSRPGRAIPPSYASGGSGAVSQYDTNGDGAIADAELDAAGSLKASLRQVDADGDGRLTASEIDARIQSWRDTKIAEMIMRVQVTLDGDPLAGAEIIFEPEAFLGSKVPPASVTTGPSGMGSASMPEDRLSDARYPGVACGWYKIRVTSSQDPIPAKYNTETILGCEVAKNAHWTSNDYIQIDLTSN